MNGAPPFFHRARHGFLLTVLVLSVAAGFPVRVQLSGAADSQRVEVVVGDYFFSPRSLNASTGMTVVWNYSGPGSALHTVTSENQTGGGSPVFASPYMSPGYTYSLVFSLPGVYRYYCAFHPTLMRDAWVNVSGPPLSNDGAPGYSALILVAGGIGAVALVAVLTVFLVRRRRRASADSTSQPKPLSSFLDKPRLGYSRVLVEDGFHGDC